MALFEASSWLGPLPPTRARARASDQRVARAAIFRKSSWDQFGGALEETLIPKVCSLHVLSSAIRFTNDRLMYNVSLRFWQ